MNTSELTSKVAEAAGVDRKTVTAVLGALEAAVTAEVKAGNKITVFGLCTFDVVFRKARKGRNPQTKTATDLPAKNVVRVKAAKQIRDSTPAVGGV